LDRGKYAGDVSDVARVKITVEGVEDDTEGKYDGEGARLGVNAVSDGYRLMAGWPDSDGADAINEGAAERMMVFGGGC
jgi:hypothetical protein